MTLEIQSTIPLITIWWVMYPVENGIMPYRKIHVQYPTTPQVLDPMPYPSGSWEIPGQPSPYNTFWIEFSRISSDPEILNETQVWHVTITTYPICYEESCYGLDPNTLGCDIDATTAAQKPLKAPFTNIQIGLVENRQSLICMAQWEKTKNMSIAYMYAEGSIRWGDNQYTSYLPQYSPYAIASNESIYTPMYGASDGLGPSLNCGALSATGPIKPPKSVASGSSYYQNNCVAR